MFKLVTIVLAAGFVAAPALAHPISEKLDFTRDNVRYTGTVVTYDDGSRRISGWEVESGRDFALFVANGRVSGRYDGQPVSYAAPASHAAVKLADAAGGF